MVARERVLALAEHTNVMIVPSDEIDMREETPTDALYLFKYSCYFAPWHAFVNICDDKCQGHISRFGTTRP